MPSAVPRLDLAPKLKRPLSLLNPFDYLRLLYWVFYFPQALRWYVDTFGGGDGGSTDGTWQARLERLLRNSVNRQLLLQGVLLTEVTAVLIALGLARLQIPISWGGVAGGVTVGVAVGVALGVAVGVAVGVAYGMALGVAGGVTILRPEAWLGGTILSVLDPGADRLNLGAATPLPLPHLHRHLSQWLRQDWETGLHNSNQLLAYSMQFIPVIQALNRELARLPADQLIYRTAQLASQPYDWDAVRFNSASLSQALGAEFLKYFFILPLRRRWVSRLNTDLRLDTPARAAAAGFWFLHNGQPEAAGKAFEHVQDLLYGAEMVALADSLARCQQATTVEEMAAVAVPEFPPEPRLRAVTWRAMQRFCHVISDTKTVVESVSRTSKAFASNRALGELKHILNHVAEVPAAERQLIEDIAKQWRNALLDVATSVGEQTIEGPVQNPYVVGDPVEGDLFVGRKDILRQLEELWLMGRQMQSVVLYGHRRMGKTSILRNAAKTVGSGLRLVYVNMLQAASAESLSDVLIAITDELAAVLNVPPPSDEALMAQPTRSFDRYLKRVLDGLGDTETLIIAIDEFEKIEELIDAGKLAPSFIAHFRGLVQMSPELGFAFAGLHTLEEMTQDYFNPFFASVIAIKVGFLSPGAVRQLLANPAPEFLLDYQPEALERIYQLTHGQPYLTQLVGFQLVRRYNDQRFEQGSQREAIFTVTDVDAVINDSQLFTRGRYYFTGIWDQAGRDIPEQQAILQALAPYPEGRLLSDLKSATKLQRAQLTPALDLLQRHDVVQVEDDRAVILVELFRRWLLHQ